MFYGCFFTYPGTVNDMSGEQICEDVAVFTYFKFGLMITLHCTFAEGSTQKPAKMTALKFPGWTLILDSALLVFPTWFQVIFSASLVNEEKIEMSFDVIGDCSPTLLVTMYGLK